MTCATNRELLNLANERERLRRRNRELERLNAKLTLKLSAADEVLDFYGSECPTLTARLRVALASQ